MSDEIGEEREFSEKIDRLLAGEEVQAGEDASEDYRTTINFAQKLTSLRSDPSPHFKGQLRKRLLSKLADQQAEKTRPKEKGSAFREAFRNLIPRNPVWRTATATVTVAVLAIIVLWGSGIFTPAPEQMGVRGPVPEVAPVPQMAPSPAEGGLQTSAVVEAPVSETVVAAFSEEVKIDLVFRNVSSESMRVAPFPPAIHVIRAETDEVIRSLAEGNESRELLPSGTLDYILVWDQLDDNRRQVDPGRYSIFVNDVVIHKDIEPRETRQGFGHLTDVIIQPP
jgi:hypothetical protein